MVTRSGLIYGATTLSLTALRLTTLVLMGLMATLSMNETQHHLGEELYYAECGFAEYRYSDC